MVSTAAQIAAQNASTIATIKAGGTTAKKTDDQALGANQATFLTLLTKQLQNQDPLNPMDTADFTNQLVLYTQAEQQIKTNSKLDDLIASNKGTIGTQALGYIGKEVSFSSNELHADTAGEQQTFYYSLPDVASSVKVSILDSAGNPVRTIASTNDSGTAGSHKIVWDGLNDNGNPVPAGDYTLSIGAVDSQNAAITPSTLVSGKVTGIASDGAGSVNLILSGDRSIAISNILSVSQMPEATSSTSS